jgi:hypothetical protein
LNHPSPYSRIFCPNSKRFNHGRNHIQRYATAYYLANQKANAEFNDNSVDVPLGAAKALPRGLIELDNSAVHGLQHLGIGTNEKDVPIPDALQSKNTSQDIGGGIENILEFMYGEGELKAAGMGGKAMELAKTSDKFAAMTKTAKFLEENPKLANLLGNSIRQGTVSGAQTLAHGGSGEDALKSAAIGTGIGAAAEGAGLGLQKIGSTISDAAAASPTAVTPTAAAADEFGVPLSYGQQTGSPLAQNIEGQLKKLPFINTPFNKLAGAQNDAITKAADGIANDIAAKGGSATQTGEGIQNAINDAKGAASKVYGDALGKISANGAGDLPIPLKGNISDTAQKMLDSIQLPDDLSAGVQDVQGRQGAVNVLKNLANDTAEDGTPRTMTWEQARRLSSQISDMANTGDSNVGKGALKQMAGALKQSMQDTLTGSGNADLAQQFTQANNILEISVMP